MQNVSPSISSDPIKEREDSEYKHRIHSGENLFSKLKLSFRSLERN